MWKRLDPERGPNGMPVYPFVCSHCHDRIVFFQSYDLPGDCPRCLGINDLILNEDGSFDTTRPTEEDLAEIDRLRKENEELKAKLGELSFRLIVMELKDQGYDISKFTDEHEE